MAVKRTRRDFLRKGAAATAGIIAVGAAQTTDAANQTDKHEHDPKVPPAVKDYPRDHPGWGGLAGAPADRGRLVPGQRAAGLAPVPIVSPDLDPLPHQMKDGFKEFHLVAKHTRREFLPGAWMDVWGYNDSMPGPTIEVNQGDRVRIILHNELPESTTLHLHGIELPNRFDGVHGVTQDPIPPGRSMAYEFDAFQEGTYIYHSHGPMQEGLGMSGLLIIQPREAYLPPVDHDFGLLIQEWAILPQSTIPNVTSMEFNWFTINGRSGPYTTPMLVRLGSRVRIRFVNMSPIDHHPMHLHGHTFWVVGGDGGRWPESAWIPANNVLVGVAQSRDIEFIANNPGDWILHCHMFHHMMNHMTVMVGPMGGHSRGGMPAGANAQSGMGMTQGGSALSQDNGPSMGRAMGEQTSNERAVRTGSQDMGGQGPHAMPGMQHTNGQRVPGFPADMMDMMGMMSEEEMMKVNKPQTRGMRRNWSAGVEALHTVVRVLPPELYDQVVSGKGDIKPGASVPGGTPGMMPGGHQMKGHDMKGHDMKGHDMSDPKMDKKSEHKHGP